MSTKGRFILNLRSSIRLPRPHSEQGIAALLLAIVIPIFLVLMALAVFPSYTRLTRSELQTSVDAAAHAAAMAICSSQACFDDARQRAIEVLSRQQIHGRTGFARNFNLNPADGPVWSVADDYEITILRGAWWPDGVPTGSIYNALPGENRFLMLETADGTPAQPPAFEANVPPYVAANAIYVKIAIKKYTDPLSFVPSSGIDLSAEAVAVAGATREVSVAPFAVPVCAIVDPNGAFNPQTICNRDFFFARRDRYCPADDPNCNVTPGVFGSVRRDFTGLRAEEQCSWLHAPVASDVFGFVGAPGMTATEGNLIAAIASGSMKTHLGDSFHILDAGFTSSAALSSLQSKMVTSFPSLGSGWLGAMRYPDSFSGNGAEAEWTHQPNNPMDCRVQANRGWGACNSLVFNLTGNDNWTRYNIDANSPDSCTGAVMGTVDWPTYEGQPYWPNTAHPPVFWPTKAAVVAWDGMDSCQGTAGAGNDPAPPPSGVPLRVVGYVDLAIYDLDIGQPPPAPPEYTYTKPGGYWFGDDSCQPVENCEYGEEDCWQAASGPPDPSYECESSYEDTKCQDEYVCDWNCEPSTDPEIPDCQWVESCEMQEVCKQILMCCGRSRTCNTDYSPLCDPPTSLSCTNGHPENTAGATHTPWGFSPPVAVGDPDFHCNLVRGQVSCDNTMVPSGSTGAPDKISLVR